MKTNKSVTFHMVVLGGYVPIVVICDSDDECSHVCSDVVSLLGYSHVKINNCGRYRKDSIVITAKDYWKYENHDKWADEYYNKCFNPSNF